MPWNLCKAAAQQYVQHAIMLQKLFHECTAHSHEERCCSRWHARCLRTDAATTATARSWQVTVAAASPRAVPGVDVALPADAGSLALPSLRLGGVALEIVSNNALCRLVHVFQRALILGLLGLAVLVLGCGRHRPVVGAALLLACALALERRLGPAAVKQRPENLREPCSAQQQGKAIAQASATGLDAEASVLCCGPFQISDMGRYYPAGRAQPAAPSNAQRCARLPLLTCAHVVQQVRAHDHCGLARGPGPCGHQGPMQDGQHCSSSSVDN